MTSLVLDAHVHLYECFDLQRLLDAARNNFSKVVEQQGLIEGDAALCLLCVDLQDRDFDTTIERLSQVPGYEVKAVSETEPYSRSLLHLASDMQLQIIWGHQIISAENLEVLAFGLTQPIANGTPLNDIMAGLQQARFGIVPWGFGKWSGQRGQRVHQLLHESASADADALWWVGDNGGRLAMSPLPAQIEEAAELERWNIPGSDPLPFPDHASRVGSYGVILNGAYDPQAPMLSVRALLASATEQPRVFGDGVSLLPFVCNQIGMQWRKHSRKVRKTRP